MIHFQILWFKHKKKIGQDHFPVGIDINFSPKSLERMLFQRGCSEISMTGVTKSVKLTTENSDLISIYVMTHGKYFPALFWKNPFFQWRRCSSPPLFPSTYLKLMSSNFFFQVFAIFAPATQGFHHVLLLPLDRRMGLDWTLGQRQFPGSPPCRVCKVPHFAIFHRVRQYWLQKFLHEHHSGE